MALGTRPFGGYDASALLNASDPEQRDAMMRQMGVANVDPPLPHSPCLKQKKTGRVFPWTPMFAEQRDLFECCDESGNTDPAAWEPLVVTTEPMTNAELEALAQQRILMQRSVAQNTEFEHDVPSTKLNTGPSEYEKQGVIAFKDLQVLREKLSKPAETPDE